MRVWRRLTGEVGTGAVDAQVAAVSVWGVALVHALVGGLQLGNVQHNRVSAQPLDVDFLAVDTLGVQGIGVVVLGRAHDTDLSIGSCVQVHGPLKVLFHSFLVAGHITPDGDVRSFRSNQRPRLNCDLPLGRARAHCKTDRRRGQ